MVQSWAIVPCIKENNIDDFRLASSLFALTIGFSALHCRLRANELCSCHRGGLAGVYPES
jgi:hypothetical protein